MSDNSTGFSLRWGIGFMLLLVMAASADVSGDYSAGRGINFTGDDNLTINLNNTVDGEQTFLDNMTFTGDIIEFWNDGTKYLEINVSSDGINIVAYNNQDINIFSDNGIGITIEDDGDVGIGEPNPTYELDIGDDLRVQDDLFILGDSIFTGSVNITDFLDVFIEDGTSFHAVHLNSLAGVDQYQFLTVDTDIKGYTGVVGINSYMESSVLDGETHTDNVLLEAEVSNITGEYHAIDFAIIGNKSEDLDTDAMSVSPEFDHIIHVGSPDTLLAGAYTVSGAMSDGLANFTEAGSDVTLFTEDNDWAYFGSNTNFTEISVSLNTTANLNVGLEYYYCNLTWEWKPLTVILDSTNGFKIGGGISFIAPSDWGVCNQNQTGTAFDETTNYSYIALKRTKNVVSTPPIESLFTISGGQVHMLLQNDMFMLNPVSSPPETCSTLFQGGIYVDSDLHLPCFCDGTDWLQMDDYSTVCS